MTSPLTGGFEFCFEVSEAVLSSFVSSTFANTRRDFPIAGEYEGISIPGTASLLIDNATMSIDPAHPGNGVLAFEFSDSALSVTVKQTSKTVQAMPLAASVTVSVPFALSAPAGKHPSRSLELDFTHAQPPVVKLDPHDPIPNDPNSPSVKNIEHALATVGLSVPPSEIPTFLTTVMQTALTQNLGAFTIPNIPAFSLAPAGQDGSLSPPQFQPDITLTTRAPEPQAPGVLAILGTILEGDVANDNTVAKSATATDKPHQGSVTMAPDAVQGLVNKFANLPAGLAVTVTLQNGSIAVHAGGSLSEPGVTVDVTGDATVTLSITNGVLTPHIQVNDEHVSINLAWWVWLLSVVVPEVTLIGGLPVVAMLDAIANIVANSLVQQVLSELVPVVNKLGVQTGGVAAPFTFDAVKITPKGITLFAHAPTPTTGTSTTVRGMVTDQDSEAPVQGAIVVIDPPPGKNVQASTDQHGVYSFGAFALDAFASDPPGTSHTITAAQADYLTGIETVAIKWGQTVDKDFTLQAAKPITVKGLVSANGAPLKGATVTVNYGDPPNLYVGPPPATTGGDGHYSFSFSPGQYAGDYTVSVAAPGLDPQVRPIGTIGNGATIEQDFTLVAPHPFAVTGQVTLLVETANDTTVGPLAGAAISVFPTVQPAPPLPTYTGHTDQNGNYTIPDVNPATYTGAYTVMVEAAKMGSAKQEIVQPAGASVEADFQLSKTVGPPPHPVKPGAAV